jgi:hypothetical protein
MHPASQPAGQPACQPASQTALISSLFFKNELKIGMALFLKREKQKFDFFNSVIFFLFIITFVQVEILSRIFSIL